MILSGGDPLTLDDCRLAQLAQRLERIGHLRRLRVHTRMPIVIPRRVRPSSIAWLRGTRLTSIMVVHVNHPAEIDSAVADALARLVDAGIVVLSQTVLLREVNDRADVLAELCERLVDLRVMPYYLHQLDRVAGAAHFEVPEARGRALVAQLAPTDCPATRCLGTSGRFPTRRARLRWRSRPRRSPRGCTIGVWAMGAGRRWGECDGTRWARSRSSLASSPSSQRLNWANASTLHRTAEGSRSASSQRSRRPNRWRLSLMPSSFPVFPSPLARRPVSSIRIYVGPEWPVQVRFWRVPAP